jgi:hypothetical protein
VVFAVLGCNTPLRLSQANRHAGSVVKVITHETYYVGTICGFTNGVLTIQAGDCKLEIVEDRIRHVERLHW